MYIPRRRRPHERFDEEYSIFNEDGLLPITTTSIHHTTYATTTRHAWRRQTTVDKKKLPRERGGCAKNSENSGRRRIERRKGMKIWDRGSLDVYDASKAEGASSEVNIKSRKSGSEKGKVSR